MDITTRRKSTYSSSGGTCIEVADGPVPHFPAPAWQSFITDLHTGELDPPSTHGADQPFWGEFTVRRVTSSAESPTVMLRRRSVSLLKKRWGSVRLRNTLCAAASAAFLLVGLAANPAAGAAKRDLVQVGPGVYEGNDCDRYDYVVCLFRDREFQGGGLALVKGAKVRLSDYGFDKQMSSWANNYDDESRSGYHAKCYWYADPDGRGTWHDMRSGFRVNLPPDEDKTASLVVC